MAVPRFYAGPGPLTAGPLRLASAEAAHASRSRRLQIDDVVTLFDGLGAEGPGRIVAIDPAAVAIEVDHVDHREADARCRLILITAIPKGPRQDVLIEKCTELGVAELCPALCARSVVKPAASRVSKWTRTAVEACKQAQRAWLPLIRPPASLTEWLARYAAADSRWLADPSAAPLAEQPRDGSTVVVAVGPEGGFDPAELEAARLHGYVGLRLGDTILRTETAAVAAAARLLL